MTMAIRNSDITRSYKNRIATIAIALFALVASLSFNDAHAASVPNFNDQEAFRLTAEDRDLYGAEFAWCLPTPADGNQCYVLGSTMAGWLGRGDSDNVENAKTYGDFGKGLIPVAQLPAKDRAEAYEAFKAVWGK